MKSKTKVLGFHLDDQQLQELWDWQEKIKECYGQFGQYDYKFTPTGIGTAIVVYSHISGWSIDLSHEENW